MEEPTTSPRIRVIMFTDLLNSTKLKEQIGAEAYRALKSKHDAFIRQGLALAPTGQVLQDTGDGYFVSFDSVAQAVAAALVFQALMAREAWPHPFTSRVGLHLGEVAEGHSAVTGRPEFISSAIDQASRTMSLAVGGQILLTRAVYDSARLVVREHPPVGPDVPRPALEWRAHGPYLFKGCVEAVDVFEVGAQGTAPLTAPPDSEKARRPVAPEASAPVPYWTRRIFVAAAVIGAPILGVAAWLRRRPASNIEGMRAKIEREVAFIQAKPPAVVGPPGEVKTVDLIQTSDNAGFDILNDDRVVDMRGWKLVPTARLNEPHSLIAVTRRIRLKKNRPVDTFEMQARTAGLDVVLACQENYPCAYEAQRVESFVGEERMKVRKVSIDVSSVEVGQEFDLRVMQTYINSMQTPVEQWFGLIGYRSSFLSSLLLLFPDKRPFKTYEMKVVVADRATPVDYAGERLVLAGETREWIYWEVPKPLSGHVYRLHWTW
ncbi:MAG TPA: adenylate/guanylate cyclase domain-containing protein [Planctomycetota bacterium]